MTKKRNLSITLIVLALIVLLLNIISNVITYFTLKQDETNYIYKITYEEDFEPGASTSYYLYTDGNIKVQRTTYCSAINCPATTSDLENINFDKETKKITYHYLLSLTKGQKDTKIKHSDIYNDDKKISIFNYLNSEDTDLIKLEIDDYQYKLELSKDNNYHLIYLKENTITAANLYYKNYDREKVQIHKLKFNETNTKLIKEFILNQYEKEETYKNIYYSSFEHKDKIILDAIISNNETLLSNIEKEKNLLYKLGFTGLNCLTPSLDIYDDSTYEFYNTYTTDGTNPTPKKGTYNYDLNKLITASVDENILDNGVAFVLTNKDKTYYYEVTNPTLNEFLNTTTLTISSFTCGLEAE